MQTPVRIQCDSRVARNCDVRARLVIEVARGGHEQARAVVAAAQENHEELRVRFGRGEEAARAGEERRRGEDRQQGTSIHPYMNSGAASALDGTPAREAKACANSNRVVS